MQGRYEEYRVIRGVLGMYRMGIRISQVPGGCREGMQTGEKGKGIGRYRVGRLGIRGDLGGWFGSIFVHDFETPFDIQEMFYYC